jgi:hypothetical protein
VTGTDEWARTGVVSAVHRSGVRLEATDFEGALLTLSPAEGVPRCVSIPALTLRDHAPWQEGGRLESGLHVSGVDPLLTAFLDPTTRA